MKRRSCLSRLKFLAYLGLGLLSMQLNSQAVAQSVSDQELLKIAQSSNWRDAVFPLTQFQSYSSPFGERTDAASGKSVFHPALDMAAPYNSYVLAWMPGQVIAVSEDAICGTSVKIRSGNWIHLYCHLQGSVESNSTGQYLSDRTGGIQVRRGQFVQAGDRIGRVGMTGRTSGPHLHWGLRYGDRWVNPALVLQTMLQQQQAGLVSRLSR